MKPLSAIRPPVSPHLVLLASASIPSRCFPGIYVTDTIISWILPLSIRNISCRARNAGLPPRKHSRKMRAFSSNIHGIYYFLYSWLFRIYQPICRLLYTEPPNRSVFFGDFRVRFSPAFSVTFFRKIRLGGPCSLLSGFEWNYIMEKRAGFLCITYRAPNCP